MGHVSMSRMISFHAFGPVERKFQLSNEDIISSWIFCQSCCTKTCSFSALSIWKHCSNVITHSDSDPSSEHSTINNRQLSACHTTPSALHLMSICPLFISLPLQNNHTAAKTALVQWFSTFMHWHNHTGRWHRISWTPWMRRAPAITDLGDKRLGPLRHRATTNHYILKLFCSLSLISSNKVCDRLLCRDINMI